MGLDPLLRDVFTSTWPVTVVVAKGWSPAHVERNVDRAVSRLTHPTDPEIMHAVTYAEGVAYLKLSVEPDTIRRGLRVGRTIRQAVPGRTSEQPTTRLLRPVPEGPPESALRSVKGGPSPFRRAGS